MMAAGRDAPAAATAGAIAWLLASWLFGHTHPVFAMVTAIVCLAPGLPNHGRQATGIILGVTIGILVGEAALQLPVSGIGGPTMSLLRMIVAILLSMMVGASFGLPAVVPIQAGVSAVLVLAMGADSAGWHARMTGTAPPDPGVARTGNSDSAWSAVLVQMRALGAILGAGARLDQERREAYQLPD
ncbi:FUSC family protein [Paracoccus sp. IB05]|uniref:FUSC family protein n=1 Tax=Paracoccus sp. IB05 TaxID=2779367 RepID=UPI0018E8C856|nr:FUSC family protein [Paracoccus sp. IB05]MBJ2151606.1 FUSC family protein [Paracoccus sp. IB05]